MAEGFTFVQERSGIAEFTLDANGMQVLVAQQRVAPVVTLMVTYRVGSRNEGAGLTGATHFLEHLMFKGSRRFNKRAGASVFNVLQQVGAQINATTWLDRTNYYELLPAEHLDLAMDVESDRMRGALLDPADVEQERTVILNEFDRGENDPLRKLHQAIFATAYQAHPYRHPTIGWRCDIEQITADDLRGFYDTFYWPNLATLSVIGDVEPEAALALAARRFGGIPAAPVAPAAVRTREPAQEGARRVEVRRPGELGALTLAFKGPDGLHPDADALDVLSVLLSLGKSSLLYRRLTDRGLATSAHAANFRLRDPGLFYLTVQLPPGRTHAEAEEAVWACLREAQSGSFTPEDVQRAQAQLAARQAYSKDGPFAVASLLNEAIAVGDWTLYASYLDRVAAVSAGDVAEAARRWLQPAHSTVGEYIPTAGEDRL